MRRRREGAQVEGAQVEDQPGRTRERALWSGSISFGLVNIPIRLYTAVAPHDIGFHQFAGKSGDRIRYKRVAERSGREVRYEDVVKGYELQKGKVVLVAPEELEAVEPRKSHTIDIEQFVDLHEIDPIAWDQTYFAGPQSAPGARKSYEVLRRAMQEMGKVGIGRFVMRTKEYLATVRPFGAAMAVETMFYPDEIRDEHRVSNPQGVTISSSELSLAKQLIKGLTVRWEPSKFRDTYHERVLSMIKRKARGEVISTEEAPEPTARVIDLMQALKASLRTHGNSHPRAAKRAGAHRRRSA